MASRVKGIVVEIGGDTTGLDKALQGTNKVINSTQSELKDVDRLLKLDPYNTNLLEQKQRLLAKAVEETGGKLATLEDASKQVAATAKNYDAWRAVYDPIQKEIADTSQKLTDLKSKQKDFEEVGDTNTDAYKEIAEEVKATAKALQNLKKQAKAVSDEFGNPISPEQFDRLQREIEATKQDLGKLEKEAGDVSSKLKKIDEKPIDDVADAAKEAEEALDDAGKEASTFGEVLKAELAADGIKEIAESLKDVAEDSKEYRKIMASLEVSSEKAGYSAEQTREAYKKLYGVLGDEQAAATTLANLQAIGLSQGELMGLIDTTVGAWAQYGDSIPIDGLAEAVNETIKTGQVTGNLADVLNWGAEAGETYGVAMKAATKENEEWNKAVADAQTAEDYFNLALQGCSSEAERANKVLQMLANQGLAQSGQAWQENNQSLIENNQAQAELQEQTALLGETVEPVFTKITTLVAEALAWFNSLDSGSQNFILTTLAVISAITMLTPIVTGLGTAISGLGTVMNFLAANPIVLIIAAIVAIVAAFAALWNKCEAFRNFWMNLWTSIKNGAAAGINGLLTGIEWLVNGIIGGINFLIRALNKISFDVPSWVPGIGGKKFGFDISEIDKISLPKLAIGGEVLQGSAIVGEAGPELLTVANGRTIVQPLGSSGVTNHNSTHLGSVQIVVYGAPGQDVETLADIIMDRMQTACEIKGAAL